MMHTLQAMKIVGKAVDLVDSGFSGDALAEASKGADALDLDALRCLILAQAGKLGVHPTREQTMNQLRQLAIRT